MGEGETEYGKIGKYDKVQEEENLKMLKGVYTFKHMMKIVLAS